MTNDLVISPEQSRFTDNQLAVLQQLGVKDASPADLAVFFHYCKRTGLDPFAKQIYMVGRWSARDKAVKQSIQTGIDGFRLIAERTGKYVGSTESWTEHDGKLDTATVVINKLVDGVVCEFVATARIEEYVQLSKDGDPSGLWAKMPHRMLAKCAEALALRKAFPQDLAGLVTSEEMAQATLQPVQPESTGDQLVSAANKELFKTACANEDLHWQNVLALAGIDLFEWDSLLQSDLVKLRLVFSELKAKRAAGVVAPALPGVEVPDE